MSQEQAPVFGERYELLKHIARGGMAQVYLAHDLLLDRPVALKALFPELSVDESFVERFRREAKAAANLTHPNIVSVYDWGQGENTYFIVMEYVDGPTLSQLLRQGPLQPKRAAAIAASVAAALDFAHRRGVIHRDVKPGNVLIDERSQVKVADFGIARAAGTSEDLTQTGSVMGTATYFSPEQAQGYPVDPRSDVYSLGVVLYEMVTGKPPFAGDSPVSIAYKHVKELPPAPSESNPAVPPPLEAIVLKALAKQPEARYKSAEEMRSDLVRFTNGEPVMAAAAIAAAATGIMGTVGTNPTAVYRDTSRTSVIPTPPGGVPPSGALPPGEDRSRAGLYTLIALVVVLLAVGGYFGGRQAGLFGSSSKTLTVPSNLTNKPVRIAKNELKQMGFTNVKTQNHASSKFKSGNVISSNPAGGSTIRSGDLLTLIVSSGPNQINVPDVTNMTQAQADQALRKAGFIPSDTQGFSSSVPNGHVISTNPAANKPAAQGSTVQVVVSNAVTIPPVAGEDPASAGQKLGALGLTVVQSQEASTAFQAGRVTRTDPAAGNKVAPGSQVTVYISTGKPQSTVPNLSGKTASQAQQALAQAGLKGSSSTVTVTDPSQDGLVQSQSPAADTSLAPGSTVSYKIGQYSATSTTSSTSTTSTTLNNQGG